MGKLVANPSPHEFVQGDFMFGEPESLRKDHFSLRSFVPLSARFTFRAAHDERARRNPYPLKRSDLRITLPRVTTAPAVKELLVACFACGSSAEMETSSLARWSAMKAKNGLPQRTTPRVHSGALLHYINHKFNNYLTTCNLHNLKRCDIVNPTLTVQRDAEDTRSLRNSNEV